MNLTFFCNHYIFPFLLFLIVSSLLLNISESDTFSNCQLESFLECVGDREDLYAQLEDIEERQDFINKLSELSRNTGHFLTALEIERGIADATLVDRDNYICLSIGCWQLS